MKDMQFTSLKSDIKVPIVLFCLGFSAFVGYLLPTPFDDSHAQLFDAGVAVILGAFVWAVFHLIEPRRHGQKWMIAEFTVIPFVWVLIILALGVWFYHLQQAREETYDIRLLH
jgi:hypothetical protein